MGLEAAEVAARQAVKKLHETFKKVHPLAYWETVEAEYNADVDAELQAGDDYDAEFQVDDDIDIGDLLGEDVPRLEGVPSGVEVPTIRGEEAHEDSGVRVDSSNTTSAEIDDEESVSETSDSDTSSSSS